MTYLLLCLTRSKGRDDCVWWGPRRNGYTIDFFAAGRYELDEAKEITAADDVEMVPVAHALPHTRSVVPTSMLTAIRDRARAEADADAVEGGAA